MRRLSNKCKRKVVESFFGDMKTYYLEDGSIDWERSKFGDGDGVDVVCSNFDINKRELNRLCQEFLDRGQDGLDNPIFKNDQSAPLFAFRQKVWVRQLRVELSVQNSSDALRKLGIVANKFDNLTPEEKTWLKRLERWEKDGTGFKTTLFDFIQLHEIIGEKVSKEVQSKMADCWVSGPRCCWQYDLGLWSAFNFPSLADYPKKIISIPPVSILQPRGLSDLPSLSYEKVRLLRELCISVAKYMLYLESFAKAFQSFYFQQEMNGIYTIDSSKDLNECLIPLTVSLGKVFDELSSAAESAAEIFGQQVFSSSEIKELAKSQAKYLLKKHYKFTGLGELTALIDFFHEDGFCEDTVKLYQVDVTCHYFSGSSD